MVTKFAPRNYQETIESIVSAFLTAPDFYCDPIGRNFTYDEVFGDMLHGIETLKAKAKSSERLLVIERVIAKLHESRAALEANDERTGITALADAKELFRSIKSIAKT